MVRTSEVIKTLTREHLLERNGLLFGQCITAVGWVAGTVPELTERDGIVELPTSDVSNGGVVVGAGLSGVRPIYVIRYQGFLWYNIASIVNYAAKSKELWKQPCPIFIRAIGMEGKIGPVAGNIHHGLAIKMPGLVVQSPMVPKEWISVWTNFLNNDNPVLCSEHRLSYQLTDDADIASNIDNSSELTLVGVSSGRLSCAEAIKNKLNANLLNIVNIKPLILSDEDLKLLDKKYILIVDAENPDCGVAQYLYYKISQLFPNVKIQYLSLEDRSAGFSTETDNLTPTYKDIINYVENFIY